MARLPGYLRALTALARDGIGSVSSEELATAAGVSSAMLRKDLSHLGSYGVRGVGYDVERLASEITSALGLTQDWPVAIVGMGNLGRALAAYRGFAERGFRVIALLDGDPRVVGEPVAGQVRPADGRPPRPRRRRRPGDRRHRHPVRRRPGGLRPASSRPACARCSTSRPAVLAVPDGVVVRTVDLSTELQILAFHGQRVAVSEVVST